MSSKFFQIFRKQTLNSTHLQRSVTFDLIVPKQQSEEPLPTLFVNDGQDWDRLAPHLICEEHYKKGGKPFIWIGIHTNERRLREYGTAHISDYKGRGDLAHDYTKFIIEELKPSLSHTLPLSTKPQSNFICGFSLGGLSAFDIAWEHPDIFSKAGVFSGSLWWRTKSYEAGYEQDLDRIIHNKVKNGPYKPGLQFWCECGTNDETEDRNNNGIIDSIDDTLELIEELKKIGYSEQDICYVEVEGGEHNFNTWQAVFPQFLEWVLETR
ncbi:alpha/beta hydrolase [Leadbetterella byssophila]|uniref:alpha/beta hydrolase n=1 Tax=Leadbetterella byssophila TaxID=316068 RepID=UPI0039A30256